MRRSRADIQLGRFLRIGQPYRHRDTGKVWRVRQVHRADCQLELDDGLGQHILIAFAELRTHWDLLVPLPQATTA